MPAKLIQKYTSQADWQSGSSDGLDLNSRPGDIVPSADYVKEYALAADWNAGTKSGTTVNGNALELADTGANLEAGSIRNANFQMMRQRITARGSVEYVGWKMSTSSGTAAVTISLVRVSDLSTIWQYSTTVTTTTQFYGADPRVAGSPVGPIELTEDVYVMVFDAASAVRKYLTETTDPVFGGYKAEYNTGSGWGDPGYANPNYGSLKLIVRGGFPISGTWTSPWLNHGKGASPASTWLKWLASLPEGSGVAAHVRWSPNNGSTYSEWAEAHSGEPMPGPVNSYLQLRLTLTPTEDRGETPSVSKLTAIVGDLHRWTSPAISLSDAGDPKTFSMLFVGLAVTVEASLDGGAWLPVSGVFETGEAAEMRLRFTLLRTDSGDQYFSEVSLYEALVLVMLDDPTPSIRPPEVTDVICYVEDSSPLIEVTASLPGIPDSERVEVRISVPAGSSQAYAQAAADAYLAAHGTEKRSLRCKVAPCTRVTFGELVSVIYEPWGHDADNPWQAMVQEITHRILASPPHTELVLGDFEPDDAEVLVRLLTRSREG